jgi:hypothetical protein
MWTRLCPEEFKARFFHTQPAAGIVTIGKSVWKVLATTHRIKNRTKSLSGVACPKPGGRIRLIEWSEIRTWWPLSAGFTGQVGSIRTW